MTTRYIVLIITLFASTGAVYAQDLESVAAATQVFTGGLPTDDTSATTEWTVDISTSTRNNFKTFGSTASEDSVGVGIVTADFGKWDASLIVCEGIGTHKEGIGATETYYDIVVGRSHDFGREDQWSFWEGTEIFYAPPQLGGDHLQFLAPLATVSRDLSKRVSTTFGVQAVLPVDTTYNGDDVFGWAEIGLSRSWSRLTVTLTPGVVLGNTGRYTLYLAPTAEWEFKSGLTFYVSGLGAKNVTGDGVGSRIRPTPTVGFTYNF